MSSKASNPPGRAEVRPGTHSSDPETVQSVSPLGYDVDLAIACEKREQEMSFWDAVRADKRLIMYTIGFSGTIIMEGYGLATIGNCLGIYRFLNMFGEVVVDAHGVPVIDKDYPGQDLVKYQIAPHWQTLFGLMAQFGSLIGIMITPWFTNMLGYKKTVIIMVLLSAALVTFPVVATSVPVLLAGFLLQGIPWGVFQVVSPTYASEIASIQLRPILTTWNNLCWVIGQFLAAGVIMGFFSDMSDKSFRIPLAIQWAFAGVLLIALVFAPESPYWYLKKGRVNEARKAITKLVRKGNPGLAEEKLALMRHTLEQENKHDEADTTVKGFRKYMGLFSNNVDARRTEIACVTWVIQALCGSSLLGWTIIFLNSTGMARELLFKVNLAGPAAGLFGTIASWWLMQYVGRRAIYLWGCIAMFLLLVGCGFSSFEQAKNMRGMIAGGILAVITLVYDLTLGPICYSIVSEIPSVRRRAATVSAARGMYLVSNLSNYWLTPLMVNDVENHGWGWGPKAGFYHAGWCILGAIYTYFRIPETNNLSARGMDILFQSKTSARKFSPEKATELESNQAVTSAFRRTSSGDTGDKAVARVVEKP